MRLPNNLSKPLIILEGVPHPAVFDLPNTWSETTFALSWKVNCSTTAPVISYRFLIFLHGQDTFVIKNVHLWFIFSIIKNRISFSMYRNQLKFVTKGNKACVKYTRQFNL